MEIVGILHELARHRLLVALGALLAVLIGLNAVYQISPLPPKLHSRTHSAGSASARVLVSALDESTFDLDSDFGDTLGTRAMLAADLLASEAKRAEIARRTGVPADQVAVIVPAMGQPQVAIPLPVKATAAAAMATEPYVLTVTADGRIPIITTSASAPDLAGAAKLVEAATGTLGDLLSSRATGGPDLVARQLGRATGKSVATGPKRVFAVAGAIVVFSAWCTGLVFVAGIRRRRRRRRTPRSAVGRAVRT